MNQLPPQHILTELLHYNRRTGALIWRASGRPAGNVNARGYRYVGIQGRVFLAHRLIWKLMTGEDPPNVIDHMDNRPWNNAWTNLRLATQSENCGNSCISRRKLYSPLKGVTWANNRWRAQIMVKRRNIYLGCFDTPEEAHAAYVKAAKEHFGEFARS